MGLIFGAKDIEAGKELKSTHLFEKMQVIPIQYPDGTTGAQRFMKMEPPRLIKSHLNFDFYQKQMEIYPHMKIINLYRNPKDTMVSLFKYSKEHLLTGKFTGTWDQFFDLAIQGKLFLGDFFDFTSKWYKFNKERKNSLVIKYEDMKQDRRGHILKIAKFMGCEVSDKVVDYILQKTSVSVMQNEVNSVPQKQNFPVQGPNLVRKGEVGDWMNYFSKEQSELVDAKCKEFFEPLGLTFEYSDK